MSGSPVTGLVRGWVRLYTSGLPAELRDARRDEVDDDLWCEHQEALATGHSARSLDADRVLRLLFGIPADVSWRRTYRGRAAATGIERSSSMSTSVLGVLAIGAALSWGTLGFVASSIGDAMWTRYAGLTVTILIAGALAYLAVAFGLALRYQDRVSPVGTAGAMLVALGSFGAIAAVGGLLMAPLIIGTAMLMWDLARIGVVSRLIPIVQGTIAILFTLGFLFPAVSTVVWVFVFGPFMLTWVAIGMSLMRGVPRAEAPSA
jgi:hypothetical protein